MLVVSAEPGVKSDLLQATFECATCAYGETAVVKRRFFHRALKSPSLLALSSRAYRLMAEL